MRTWRSDVRSVGERARSTSPSGDTITALPNLTFNVGIRYDNQQVFSSDGTRWFAIAQVDSTAGSLTPDGIVAY